MLAQVRQPGFAPGFSDWGSDVLDETGRLSLWIYDAVSNPKYDLK